MKTNTNSRYAVAVLIDGDNASFEKMEDIMGFVSRYGDAIVRRIYGDWTKKALSAWKETAREHGFRLVQASSHASGKNTTDIALVGKSHQTDPQCLTILIPFNIPWQYSS